MVAMARPQNGTICQFRYNDHIAWSRRKHWSWTEWPAWCRTILWPLWTYDWYHDTKPITAFSNCHENLTCWKDNNKNITLYLSNFYIFTSCVSSRVIELDLSFCVCFCVPGFLGHTLCTYMCVTKSIITKGLYIGRSRGVPERSGVFIKSNFKMSAR